MSDNELEAKVELLVALLNKANREIEELKRENDELSQAVFQATYS